MAHIAITQEEGMEMYKAKYVKDNGEESEEVRISFAVLDLLVGHHFKRYVDSLHSRISKLEEREINECT